ncbi:MAG: phosphoribosylformylglycinamidine cyclo-ligase, partial [Deltaproteobacteria bacterium]|nr:phosphoribosylformylglycinamidine cyclo-ligase [Deltaproteobacteria bacterium]
MTYKKAGVDIDAADDFVQKIKPFIKKTENRRVLGSIGHYAGLFSLANSGYKEPVLCASTDGVGTKLKLALQCGDLSGLGQDLVAMSANDILCLGARPLFFLDYFATSRLDQRQASTLIEGIAEACASIRCPLIGGETAEMPSLYK